MFHNRSKSLSLLIAIVSNWKSGTDLLFFLQFTEYICASNSSYSFELSLMPDYENTLTNCCTYPGYTLLLSPCGYGGCN